MAVAFHLTLGLLITLGLASVCARPHDFVATGPATPHALITLLLALPPSNIEGLHESLMNVSDPASPSYGEYLSKTEVRVIGGSSSTTFIVAIVTDNIVRRLNALFLPARSVRQP